MSSRKIEIFKTSDCVDKERLTKYVQGKMTNAEKHIVEKHLTDCELCSDAAEGLAMLTTMQPLDETSKQVSDKYYATSKQSFLNGFYIYNSKRGHKYFICLAWSFIKQIILN